MGKSALVQSFSSDGTHYSKNYNMVSLCIVCCIQSYVFVEDNLTNWLRFCPNNLIN